MSTDRYLSAYYFMSTDLCMNRQHIRNDMLWLKAHAYDGIHIACHEEHYRQPLGMNLIIEEAHRVGIDVFAIPSRWCGLIAGWPVLTGHFAATRPDCWAANEDGTPSFKPFCGPLCSVHHPDVQEYMVTCTERMLDTFDFDGITWDELKTLHEKDYSTYAIEKFGAAPTDEQQIQATLDIFELCNRAAKARKPDLRIASFLYAQLPEEVIEPWAKTWGFDDIGPDGHVARTEDFNLPPHANKVLIDHTSKFKKFADANGKRTFALIETQGFTAEKARVTLQRLPEFLTLGVNHIACYYQPLVREPAGQITEEVGPILRDWRLGVTHRPDADNRNRGT